jgi:hypothetical protein
MSDESMQSQGARRAKKHRQMAKQFDAQLGKCLHCGGPLLVLGRVTVCDQNGDVCAIFCTKLGCEAHLRIRNTGKEIK